ncbi:MAG: hypothetical protein JWL90_1640 [Chthoniobacteraceae bacterium]|nr:hypothetical protein [Chthoniobacteraceae bacterium]
MIQENPRMPVHSSNSFMHKSSRQILSALLLPLTAFIAGREASAAPLLQANDRVVIYGDSITEQRLYSRYLQQYIDCRYPELNVKFYNAGWGGDTAPGALNRLERDVLVQNPTVVTLFFGMNDGTYKPLTDEIAARYRTGMDGLLAKLKEKGIRVLVFTPGCVDYDKQAKLRTADYNATLSALGDIGKELAAKYGFAFHDVIHPMLEFQTAQKAGDPAFSMIPDSVHPNPAGHLVMAHLMLEGLGAEPMPALGKIDLATGSGEGLKLAGKSEEVITLEATSPKNLPFWSDPNSANVMRASGFEAFAGTGLTVRGLATGRYRVAIDGAPAGDYDADQLETGVSIPGSFSRTAKRLHDLIEAKENNYFSAWRGVRLPLNDTPGSGVIVEKLMAADDAFDTLIHEVSKPGAKTTITLTALK